MGDNDETAFNNSTVVLARHDPDDPCFSPACRAAKQTAILAEMAAQDAEKDMQKTCRTHNQMLVAMGALVTLIIGTHVAYSRCVAALGAGNLMCKAALGAIILLVLILVAIIILIFLHARKVVRKSQICNSKISAYRQAMRDVVNQCGSLCGLTYRVLSCGC